MGRIIDFRVYIEKYEIMDTPDLIKFSDNRIKYDSDWYGEDEYILMQYTGLNDKNGKWIYEGDILDCEDRIVKVKMNVECGTWDCDFIRYKGEKCSNGITPVEWKYRAKVIGNVYENPELLQNLGCTERKNR